MIKFEDILAVRDEYKEIDRLERKWEIYSQEIFEQIVRKVKLHPTRKEIVISYNQFSDHPFKNKVILELEKLGFSCENPSIANSVCITFS